MANEKLHIMFVCAGNICRSPLAEALFSALASESGAEERFAVASSGTTDYHLGQPADARMRSVARRHGVTIDHRARPLRREDLLTYDLLLAMDRSILEDIEALAGDPALLEGVRLFREFDPEAGPGEGVPDPYYGGPEGFEEVYRIVRRTAAALLRSLLDGAPPLSGRAARQKRSRRPPDAVGRAER